jgi:hypothetical protein
VKKLKRTRETPVRRARRVLRWEVDWATRYLLEGSRNHTWRGCRIRDLSREGAGVELFETTAEEIGGHRVVLEAEVPPAVYRLVGDVRHMSDGIQGGLHVGLRFSSLSAVERAMLDSLLGKESTAAK